MFAKRATLVALAVLGPGVVAQTLADGLAVALPLVRAALASVAQLAIIPMQDLLGLDSEARMNRPGTVGENWAWRFDWSQVDPRLASQLRHLNGLYGRR